MCSRALVLKKKSPMPQVLVKLWLVRHGMTTANKNGIIQATRSTATQGRAVA
jgi:hypothetical protein